MLLTLEEVLGLLEGEKGIDIVSFGLGERRDLSEHMVFVTGRSTNHMRKIGDMLVDALKKRTIPTIPQPAVEGRDEKYWMVVDCGNIIVNIFEREARELYDLEKFWRELAAGNDPLEGMSEEEVESRFALPEEWVARMEADSEMGG